MIIGFVPSSAAHARLDDHLARWFGKIKLSISGLWMITMKQRVWKRKVLKPKKYLAKYRVCSMVCLVVMGLQKCIWMLEWTIVQVFEICSFEFSTCCRS
ncbi:hypothetical protein NC652_016939 [Populus alba x Populus x berolinensis]|nr:hypothetical protein NC652_016939 [Populus alba x Populus x berolinensis]